MKKKITKERLLAWKELKDKIKKLKDKEERIRTEICDTLIKKDKRTKYELKNMKITVAPTINYTVDKYKVLSLMARGKLSIEEKQAIDTKHTLSVGAYKKLPEDTVLNEAITSKLGLPTLEIEIKESQ